MEFQRSKAAAGDCFDNVMAENLFATLECELLQQSAPFATREHAQPEISEFPEGFYNLKRSMAAELSGSGSCASGSSRGFARGV